MTLGDILFSGGGFPCSTRMGVAKTVPAKAESRTNKRIVKRRARKELGDAAYATPGFGTSLAIIGGYVLAGELLSHGEVKTALERYEEIMLPFAKNSQGGNTAMLLLNPQTQWGIRIRNGILGMVTWTKLDRLVMTVASVLGFTEKKVSMPDYQWPAE